MAGRGRKRRTSLKGTAIQIRVTPEQKNRFTETASRMGLGVSAWLRSIALQAADRVERDERQPRD